MDNGPSFQNFSGIALVAEMFGIPKDSLIKSVEIQPVWWNTQSDKPDSYNVRFEYE